MSSPFVRRWLIAHFNPETMNEEDGKTIKGPFTQSGGGFEFTLTRKDP